MVFVVVAESRHLLFDAGGTSCTRLPIPCQSQGLPPCLPHRTTLVHVFCPPPSPPRRTPFRCLCSSAVCHDPSLFRAHDGSCCRLVARILPGTFKKPSLCHLSK